MNALMIALLLLLGELVALSIAGLLFHDKLRPLVRRLTGFGRAVATPREFADQLIGANQRLRVLKGRMMMHGSDEKRLASCDQAFSALREASSEFARHPLASAEYGQAILHSCQSLIELLEDQVAAAEVFAARDKATLTRAVKSSGTEMEDETTRVDPIDTGDEENGGIAVEDDLQPAGKKVTLEDLNANQAEIERLRQDLEAAEPESQSQIPMDQMTTEIQSLTEEKPVGEAI